MSWVPAAPVAVVVAVVFVVVVDADDEDPALTMADEGEAEAAEGGAESEVDSALFSAVEDSAASPPPAAAADIRMDPPNRYNWLSITDIVCPDRSLI